jgi:hypothetical protein
MSLWTLTPAIEDQLSACFAQSVFLHHCGRAHIDCFSKTRFANFAYPNGFEPIKRKYSSQLGLIRIQSCADTTHPRFKRDSVLPMHFFIQKSIYHSSCFKPTNHRRFEGTFVHRLKGGHKSASLDEITVNTSTKQEIDKTMMNTSTKQEIDDLMDVDQALKEVTLELFKSRLRWICTSRQRHRSFRFDHIIYCRPWDLDAGAKQADPFAHKVLPSFPR